MRRKAFLLLALSAWVAPAASAAPWLRQRDSRDGLRILDPRLAGPRRDAPPAGDQLLALDLPFEVPVAGQRFTRLDVSSRGWARLAAPAGSPTAPSDGPAPPPGDTAPAWSPPSLRLSVLETDLPQSGGEILSQTLGDTLVVRWNGVRPGPAASPSTWEVLISRDGALRFQYHVLSRELPAVRMGYQLTGDTPHWLPVDRLAPGYVVELLPDASTADGAPGADADCASCPAESPWCVEAGAANPQCTEYVNIVENNPSLGCAYLKNPPPPNQPFSCCSDTRDTTWHFNESQFCLGCSYTFYALVECGTEMHLPLLDMEGLRIRVTEFLSGKPVPLICQNQELKDPAFHLVSCDRPPAGPDPGDSFYDAPALNQTNAADPTQFVEWGFNDPVPCQPTEDTTDCSLWPPGSGTIQVSAGEQQVVDCFLADPNGLCGLYRIEIESGGFDWQLLANCDGSDTPRYEIFDSCAEACASYTPRPELTVLNLTNLGTCPSAQLEFDVTNIGCAPVNGFKYRITTDCAVPDVKTVSWTGTLGANSSVHLSEPMTISCAPARVVVAIDPDNDLPDECSESSQNTRKCADIPGQDQVERDLCVCSATMNPRAGSDATVCEGDTLVLDGQASAGGGCNGSFEYRWLDDATGLEACGWSTSPTCTPGGQPFAPSVRVYRLEMRCASDPGCAEADTVRVTVAGLPGADAGPDITSCMGQTAGWLLGGSPTATGGSGSYRFDWSPAAGLSSPGVSNPVFTPSGAGSWTYRVTVTDAASGCTAVDTVAATVHTTLVADAGSDRSFCFGQPATVPLGGAPSGSGGDGALAYAWQPLSGATVAELSGTSLPNPDYTPTGPTAARFQLTVQDGAACAASAEIAIEVTAGNPPADAGNVLRAVRAGPVREDLVIQWTVSDPDAVSHNIRRDTDRHSTGGPVAAPGTASPWTAAGAVPAAPPLLLYRLSGVNCAGLEGPF